MQNNPDKQNKSEIVVAVISIQVKVKTTKMEKITWLSKRQ